MNTVTPVGVAVALAVVVALAFLFFGSGIFAPFNQPSAVATTTAAVTANAIMQDQNANQNQNATSLQVTDTTVGTGAVAEAGDTVTVDYVGELTDGTVFDASKQHGQPFTFTLGAGQVIQGWDQGVAGMKVGGVRTLVIPPALGYGGQAVGPIPANSTLVFQVTLLDVKKGS